MPSTKLVVGLTGGIGSGKTTVANLFAELDITIIDTDQLARDVTQPDSPAFNTIVEKFGKVVVLENGQLHRRALRSLIFSDPDARIWLEELLHPLIREETRLAIETIQSPYGIVVIPLLFETTHNPLINRILVVDAPDEIRAQRVQTRDNHSLLEIETIFKTQVTRELRLAGADDVILNDKDIESLTLQVNALNKFYLSIA